METGGHATRSVLNRLASDDPESAWEEFLQQHFPIVLQVVQLYQKDQDHASDCALFVCQQLHRDGCRRLRCYDPERGVSFATWLRAVVRNLCVDWQRRELGRPKAPRTVRRLPALDQEVFHRVLEGGMSQTEAFCSLQAVYPALTEERVADSVDRLFAILSSRQQWLLSVRRPKVEPLFLDDFGAGRSSLRALHRFPLAGVKIDHRFIRNLLDDDRNAALAAAIIGLGQSLGLTVVAEGVETEDQVSHLREMGCTLAEGPLFGSPTSAASMAALIPGTQG